MKWNGGTAVRKKDIIISGFMLFSLFFGAGNLIFPPLLGLESGANFWQAMIGFITTGVILPFIAIMAIALSDNGLVTIGNRVHKLFGVIFTILAYMSIGALYGIPRASSVAYELGFRQVYDSDNSLLVLLFTFLFFGATYYVCYNPKKIVDRLGQLLTPILIVVLGALFIQGFRLFENNPSQTTGDYIATPFVTGFLEGYFTMDTIGALAFGMVMINGLKDKGITAKSDIARASFWSAVIAGVGLIVVYICLGWIGNVIPGAAGITNGADVLTKASTILFAAGGSFLFGIIVILACLTTGIGLINASAIFFHETFPRFSYQTYTGIFVVIGLVVSNLGLDIILQIATPLLVFIYPMAIVLVTLSVFQHFAGGGKMMYRLPVVVSAVYAGYEVFRNLGMEVKVMESTLGIVPFFEHGLGWIIPSLVAAGVGYALDYFARLK